MEYILRTEKGSKIQFYRRALFIASLVGIELSIFLGVTVFRKKDIK